KPEAAPKVKPDHRVDGSWLEKGWYDHINIVDGLLGWPWQEPLPEIDINPLDDPRPEEVDGWLTEWAGWIKEQYPGAPVDPGAVTIYLDAAHTPESTPSQAYAYAVFGEGGAYAPIVLTPAGRSLDQQVALDKGAVAGVDRGVAQRLEALGVTSVDALSSSWSGLVAGALGIDDGAATALIADARAQIPALQSSLLGFSGVDSQLDATLKGTAFNTPVALANARPDDLVQAVVQQGTMTEAFAERLISEARRTVPADQWSLTSSQLNLKQEEITRLNQLGVTTLKQFTDLAATQAGAGSIAGVLNVTPAQVTSLSDQVTIKDAAALATDRIAVGAVTGVLGVNSETGRSLAGLGVATVGALATADPDALAAAFGGQRDSALAAINNARLRLGN
ncbi:MAG TPA: hypothetical protein VFV93_06510, partial [Thermomicrobiales bacterium]|nr:hypothetical protein [Thermomicrobiales bacterium]